MFCTVIYGLGSDLKHLECLPPEEAFRKLPDLRKQWLFVDIYYNDRLVYTTQGAAGYRYICKDCPYWGRDGQRKFVYGGC